MVSPVSDLEMGLAVWLLIVMAPSLADNQNRQDCDKRKPQAI